MSKPTLTPWPIDHPEIIAIAVDLMLTPSRRAHYSTLVLTLADAAMERILFELASRQKEATAPP